MTERTHDEASAEREDTPVKGIGWYISDTHARRAIGYLTGAVPELRKVTVPVLAAAWAEALEKTLDWNEPSPIGPEAGVVGASDVDYRWVEDLRMVAQWVEDSKAFGWRGIKAGLDMMVTRLEALVISQSAVDSSAVCTCIPCERPGGVGGSQPGRHCAECCFGTLIEEYDFNCPIEEHRAWAAKQFPGAAVEPSAEWHYHREPGAGGPGHAHSGGKLPHDHNHTNQALGRCYCGRLHTAAECEELNRDMFEDADETSAACCCLRPQTPWDRGSRCDNCRLNIHTKCTGPECKEAEAQIEALERDLAKAHRGLRGVVRLARYGNDIYKAAMKALEDSGASIVGPTADDVSAAHEHVYRCQDCGEIAPKGGA